MEIQLKFLANISLIQLEVLSLKQVKFSRLKLKDNTRGKVLMVEVSYLDPNLRLDSNFLLEDSQVHISVH
jgi:hypothetical protein